MPNKTYCSVSRKAQYTNYRIRDSRTKNKEAKLKRHIKKHPKDIQSTKRQSGTYPVLKEYHNQYEWSANWILTTLHKGVR
jgi:hypothetical protein